MAVLLAALPALYAQIAAPKGSSYLGFEYNTDDHMVYAAWMRQAMDGRFFFDNRFTTDSQPGLTVHLYFWFLGLIAKVTGIPFAANASRLVFTGLFVPLLYRLVKRVTGSVFATRLAITLTIFGGGIGFLVWHNFGVQIVRPAPPFLSQVMLGRLPVDVWQPEAFVFPSMLTNGLFMVSLCLILVVLQCFLDSRESWKPVLGGTLAVGVLMNIHSYDVLALALTMVGFVAMQWAVKQLDGIWLARGLAIAAGAIPAALWFLHVLKFDPVFQARADTPTYSANFRQVFFGYFLMLVLAVPGLFIQLKSTRQRIGLALFSSVVIALFVAAAYTTSGTNVNTGPAYFLSAPVWILAFLVVVCSLALMATESPALNLILAWALIGFVAIYFPALFQRKLTMGLSIPWAILAALGLVQLVRGRERSSRNLATVLALLMLCGSSVLWILRREPYLIRHDVSNTTVHPVFLSHDMQEIIRDLNTNQTKARTVVLALPGLPDPDRDSNGLPIPDEYATPMVPDLNPIVSGLCGVYTYAGHWSETPDYERRRSTATKVFLSQTLRDERREILSRLKPDYIIEPSSEAYGKVFADLTYLGSVVYSGSQFKLIRLDW